MGDPWSGSWTSFSVGQGAARNFQDPDVHSIFFPSTVHTQCVSCPCQKRAPAPVDRSSAMAALPRRKPSCF